MTGNEQWDLYLIKEQKLMKQWKCQYDNLIQQILDKKIWINEIKSKKHQYNSNSSMEQVSEYFRKYQQWSKLFEKRNTTDALPKHEFWDHEILFIPEYLAKQLKMGVIRKLISLAASLMLFMPKKNGEFWLCVNY